MAQEIPVKGQSLYRLNDAEARDVITRVKMVMERPCKKRGYWGNRARKTDLSICQSIIRRLCISGTDVTRMQLDNLDGWMLKKRGLRKARVDRANLRDEELTWGAEVAERRAQIFQEVWGFCVHDADWGEPDDAEKYEMSRQLARELARLPPEALGLSEEEIEDEWSHPVFELA